MKSGTLSDKMDEFDLEQPRIRLQVLENVSKSTDWILAEADEVLAVSDKLYQWVKSGNAPEKP